MNLLDSKTISSVLFAATAASVVVAAPANAFTFGNTGIQFDSDTIVEFNFRGGDGGFVDAGILDFGVVKIATDTDTLIFDSLKPADKGEKVSFFFEGGTDYSLYLDREGIAERLFSTDSLNAGLPSNQERHARFSNGDLFGNGVRIRWEDLIKNIDDSTDRDFNDYIVKAKAEAVPTPAAVLPILAGLVGAASKRKSQEEEA